MSSERKAIADEALDKIVGGYMNFNYNTNVLTYTHEETGEVTTYQIDDFEHAWKLSNSMHGDNYHEDTIIETLLNKGYIS